MKRKWPPNDAPCWHALVTRGLAEEGGGRSTREERCWEAGAKGKDEDSYVAGRLVRLRSVEAGPVLYVGAWCVWCG